MSQHTSHVASNNMPPGGNTPHGGLPFTGFDAIPMVAVAMACLFVGVVVRLWTGHAGR